MDIIDQREGYYDLLQTSLQDKYKKALLPLNDDYLLVISKKSLRLLKVFKVFYHPLLDTMECFVPLCPECFKNDELYCYDTIITCEKCEAIIEVNQLIRRFVKTPTPYEIEKDVREE